MVGENLALVIGGNIEASFVDVDTPNFDTILTSADDTVQKALDTLDDGGVPIVGKVDVVAGITKGQAVCVVGAVGDKPKIQLGDNTIHTCSHTLGVAMESKSNSQNIRVMRLGFIENVDTSSFSSGDRMHLGSAGAMQAAVVTSGAHVHMGFVTKVSVDEGIMLVAPEIYTHDIRGTTDLDIEIAAGSDDSTRKILIQNYSRSTLGFFRGDGLFQWDGSVNLGDGDDTIVFNPTAGVSFSDKNITNVGDIALDSISSAAGTSISVLLGSDAGDDFVVGNNNAFVVEGDNDRVGIGTSTPLELLQVGDNSNGDKFIAFQTDNSNERGINYYLSDGVTVRGYMKWDTREDLLLKGDEVHFVVSGDEDMGYFDATGFILRNNTASDANMSRSSKLRFKGIQSGNELTTIAMIEANHAGTGDDEKARLMFFVNDGDDGNSPTEIMRINNLGRVGINEISPDARLHISVDGAVTAMKFENKSVTDGRSVMEFEAAKSGQGYIIGINPGGGDNGMFAIRDSSSAGNPVRFSISAGGLVGINLGFGLADAMLEIATNATTEEGLKIKGSASQTGSLLLLTESTDDIYIDSGDGLAGSEFVGNQQGRNIDFRWESANQSAIFFIDASTDRIGLGTDTPSALLDFYRDQNTTTTMKINNPNTGSSAKSQLRFTAGTNDANFILDGSGDSSDPRFRIGTIDSGIDLTLKTSNTDRVRITSAGETRIGDGGTTNYAQFAVDGELTLYGTARVTKEIQIKAEGLKLGATAPTQAVIGNFSVLQFAGAGTTDTVYTSFHIPTDWATGTDVNVHVHWAPVNANAGNVLWQMTWDAIASEADELISGAGITISIIDATQTRQDELLESGDMTISGGSLTAEDTIGIRIFRDPTAGTDTYASAASLVIVEISYTADKLGVAT